MARKVGIGHNSGNVASFDAAKQERLADQYAKAAFADIDDANSKGLDGTAVQRMAAAIFCHHSTMSAIAKLSAYVDSEEARKAIKDSMTGHFLPDGRPKMSNPPTAAQLDANKLYTRHNQLVTRGCELAGILDKCKVGVEAYNARIGQWSVNPQLFCDDGFKPMSKIATTLVNGKGFLAFKPKVGANEEQLAKLYASVAALRSKYMPRAARPDAVNAGQGGSSAAQSNKPSTIAALASELTRLISNAEAKPGWVAHRYDFADADWNALTTLVKRYREMTADPRFLEAEKKQEPAKPATPAPVTQAKTA